MKYIRIILSAWMILCVSVCAMANEMAYLGRSTNSQWGQPLQIQSVAPMRTYTGNSYRTNNMQAQESVRSSYIRASREIMLTEPFSNQMPYENSINIASTDDASNPFADRGRPGGPGVPNLVPLELGWDVILFIIVLACMYSLCLMRRLGQKCAKTLDGGRSGVAPR